ncbi:hypothetical protein [uncultured Deinococcus sp.]|uniref:hypothetical protein n=1 Tax=uncultured Deinococcus sp. TaxID=158789 RepID=UPI0025FD37EA|nr:hypothetical protein [uncultured Deinococcus sp.]
MKNILLILISASMLAACAPEADTSTSTTGTTTSDTATTDTATTDTTGTDTTATDTTTDATATDTTDTTAADGTTDNAADPGTDSTLTNADDATVGEEMDMAAGDGLEGTVTAFDGTAQTFTLNENDANYAVTITPDTVFEGAATTADEFFGTDRANASVAVEGEINEGQSELIANKITLN